MANYAWLALLIVLWLLMAGVWIIYFIQKRKPHG